MKAILLELHLTYRCNLACAYCNRGCSLRTDHTPDITLAQWETFLNQLKTSNTYILGVILIGGEPTLHPDLFGFVDLTRKLCPDVGISIYSNAFTANSREILAKLKADYGIKNSGGTEKPTGSITHEEQDVFISPADLGIKRDFDCNWAGGKGCGYSVDGLGVTACSIGGAIDGLLWLGLRTWDVDEAQRRLLSLCAHCGHAWRAPDPEDARIMTVQGQRMTKTWASQAKRINRSECI